METIDKKDIPTLIPQSFPSGDGPLKESFDDILKMMTSHEGLKKSLIEMNMRSDWCSKGMFAFVCWDWVNPFVEWIGKRKVLEVMAGAGWLSGALRHRGVDIVATDYHSWGRKQKWPEIDNVINEDCRTSATTRGKDIGILIISWPYMNNFAYHTIKNLHKVNPEALIVYIGESAGGCTADSNFFEHFEEIDNDILFNKAANKFRSWYGIHDRLWLGKYKK